MRADLKAGKLVVLSTQSQADLAAQPNHFGLVGPHAYMVVGAVLDAHGHQVALLQNPWGNEPVHAVPYTSATQPLFTYASVGTTH